MHEADAEPQPVLRELPQVGPGARPPLPLVRIFCWVMGRRTRGGFVCKAHAGSDVRACDWYLTDITITPASLSLCIPRLNTCIGTRNYLFFFVLAVTGLLRGAPANLKPTHHGFRLNLPHIPLSTPRHPPVRAADRSQRPPPDALAADGPLRAAADRRDRREPQGLLGTFRFGLLWPPIYKAHNDSSTC